MKVFEALSDTRCKTERTPQGSVISYIFLILENNRIIPRLPTGNRFQKSLYYMDDLQISYRHPDQNTVEKKHLKETEV